MTEAAHPMVYRRTTLDTHSQEQVEALRLGERVFMESVRHRAAHLALLLGHEVDVDIAHSEMRHVITATFRRRDPCQT